MATPSRNRPQRLLEGESDQGFTTTNKANKTCVPCRLRKVKCDAIAVGLPCSSCKSRQCAEVCILPVRKDRSRRVAISAASNAETTASTASGSHSNSSHGLDQDAHQATHQAKRIKPSNKISISDRVDHRSPHRPESDLLYLDILHDAVKGKSDDGSSHHTTSSTDITYTSVQASLASRRSLWTDKCSRLDDISYDFLVQKGVFDVPSPQYLDTLIRIYFDCVHPFTPVLNRAEFICRYRTGDCSFFLLRVIITLASIRAPSDVLSGCGFTSPSVAQDSFFSKAKLLHDFIEEDPLVMLQGSIILCSVILDHASDRDFGYWFHDAIRLATKIELLSKCMVRDESKQVINLYRRIWWALYVRVSLRCGSVSALLLTVGLQSLDIFHVFVNPRRSRLLEDTSTIGHRSEDDWDPEDISEISCTLLSPATPQQKALPVVLCDLSQICESTFTELAKLLSIVASEPQQDPYQILHPVDAWRESLAKKMHVGGNSGTDVYYLHLQALSYRFECILCRLMRRLWPRSQQLDWSKLAKRRLRSAILELDTIAMRVLVSGTFREFPMAFVTTMTTLLALHIELALDVQETDLVRSMARISISQTMLLLNQGGDIPILKRALPVFEEIVAKKELYSVPRSCTTDMPLLPQPQSTSVVDVCPTPQPPLTVLDSTSEQDAEAPPLADEFLGLDFLDDWKLGSWSSLFDVNMDSQERAE